MTALDQALLYELQQFSGAFGLDMETALIPECWKGRGYQRLLAIVNERDSRVFDLKEWGDPQWEALRVFLEDPGHEVYGHNLAFDVKCLMASGVEVRGTLYDTMIASRLLHAGESNVKHSLADVARRTLGKVLDKSLQAQDWMGAELTNADLEYVQSDARVPLDAAGVLHEQVNAQGLLYVYELECALVPVIARMELCGLYVDTELLKSACEFYRSSRLEGEQFYVQRLDELLQEAGLPGLPRLESGELNLNAKASGSKRLGTKVEAGYNVSSVQQTAAHWCSLGIEPKNDQGKVSLDKKVLATHRHHEIVRAYEFFKKADKRAAMASKLLECVADDGRIHAQFMPLQTATGRFSAANPGLQQIPRDKEFRSAFVPPPGCAMIQADYSAMELRYLAFVANCTPMLDAFNTGVDLHTRTAALMYGKQDAEVDKSERTAAKACNFGLAYAAAPRGLKQYFATLGLYISEKEAREFHKMWHAAYPQVGEWHRRCQQNVDAGTPVRTALGRRRRLFGDENRVQIFANNTIQGGCADIMKCALVSIYKALPAGADLVATIHDEVLCTSCIPDAEEVLGIVIGEMEDAARPFVGSAVTMKAEGAVVTSWADK